MGTTARDAPASDETLPATSVDHVDASPAPLGDDDFASRYAPRALLGKGGMGEVHLYRDARIGRDVAVKSIAAGYGSHSDARRRFLREARVQGQLEHPAIVPVYDLGVGPDGDAYFTMKRVRGMTLADIVDGLRAGNAHLALRFSRRKLLTAFTSVCLAVDFAHSRGVLHRDLKPSNVMLGDFGEVYVLDWGVAKVAGAIDEPLTLASEPREKVARTATGAVMGTPGYMAPEQIAAAPSEIDARADVYALGAILFELLTYEPLVPATPSVQAMLDAAIAGVNARAAERAPDRGVPPELEALCVRATARRREDRFESARALSDAVERFLDGDRDLELRKRMAESHANEARGAARVALSDDAHANDERSRAMREVSRALALDPENQDALRTMVSLLVEPPTSMPPAAQRALDAHYRDTLRLSSRLGALAYVFWFAFVPLHLWMGVRDWPSTLVCWALIAMSAVVHFANARAATPRRSATLFAGAVSTTAIALCSLIAGPLVFVPTLLVANTAGLSVGPNTRGRLTTIVIGCLGLLVPLALQAIGAMPRTYVFREGTMVVLPWMDSLPETATLTMLAVTSVATIVTLALFVGRVRDALTDAQRRLELQAWQLRQLVPEPPSSN